jgi:cytochrome c oxidase cbb3-type subunit 1
MIGRWQEFGRNLPAKFLVVGSVMYLIGCFQGSTEALRSLQEPTHFTDFVIAHSHLTVFGTFILWALGGATYVWPKVTGAELRSFTLGNWGFWLITLGISTMGAVLIAQGLQQGYMLIAQVEWVDSLNAIRPYWWVRTFTGISMDLGMSVLVYTLLKGSLAAGRA